jgi:hypothetical protein
MDIFYGHFDYLQTFGIYNDHLIHFVLIWYIYPVFILCAKKHLATLLAVRSLQFDWIRFLGGSLISLCSIVDFEPY